MFVSRMLLYILVYVFLFVIPFYVPLCFVFLLYKKKVLFLVFHSMFVRYILVYKFVREFVLTVNGFRFKLS
jgi:hypothetical protein